MHMARVLGVITLLLMILLAGCSGSNPSAGETSGPANGTDGSGSAVPGGSQSDNRTGPTPAPISIAEGADMTQAGSKDITWDAEADFQTFTVTLTLSGVADAPNYEVNNLGYSLIGGADTTLYAEQTSSATGANVAVGTSGAVVLQFDAATATPKGDMAGAWRLHLDWQASPAHYDVHVVVRY